jgi:hypothetical protein
MEEKPKWGKPKLIVIVKGDRAEAVLMGCKYGGPVYNWQEWGGNPCNQVQAPFCSGCYSSSAS